MSTKYKEDEYVKCPYYCKETSIDIKCKGICGTHSVQNFSSGSEKQDFKEDFCIGFYWNCSQFRALIEDGK